MPLCIYLTESHNSLLAVSRLRRVASSTSRARTTMPIVLFGDGHSHIPSHQIADERVSRDQHGRSGSEELGMICSLACVPLVACCAPVEHEESSTVQGSTWSICGFLATCADKMVWVRRPRIACHLRMPRADGTFRTECLCVSAFTRHAWKDAGWTTPRGCRSCQCARAVRQVPDHHMLSAPTAPRL